MLRRNFIATMLGIFSPNPIATSPQKGAAHPNPQQPLTSWSGGSEYAVPHHLAHWLRIPQQPILTPDEAPQHEQPLASLILHHIHNGTPIPITYHGGTQPGTTRTITPVLLFQKIPNPYTLTDQPHPFANRVRPEPFTRPHTYLLAHCHLRQTTRTFRLSRITTPNIQ